MNTFGKPVFSARLSVLRPPIIINNKTAIPSQNCMFSLTYASRLLKVSLPYSLGAKRSTDIDQEEERGVQKLAKRRHRPTKRSIQRKAKGSEKSCCES